MAKEAASHLRAKVLLNFASSKQLSCNKYKSKHYTFWPLHWKWPMLTKRLSAIWWAPKYLNSRIHISYNQTNFCFVLFTIIARSHNQTKPNILKGGLRKRVVSVTLFLSRKWKRPSSGPTCTRKGTDFQVYLNSLKGKGSNKQCRN